MMRVTALFDVEEYIIENVQNVVLIVGQHLPAHPHQKGTEKYALSLLVITFMYSPKHLLLRESRYSTFFAFTPLSMKKCSLSRVVSITVLGISSRIELIFSSQLRQISCAL